MRGMNRHPVVALLSLVVLSAGCNGSVASVPSAPSVPSSPEAAATAIPTATPALPVTPTPRPPASPLPTRTASTVSADTVATTVVDGLRVRSKPRVADDSIKHEPLLPGGTTLYVLDGPVQASGYTWYEVAPLDSRTLPGGWVAAGSRTGETWLVPGGFDCPGVPTDFPSLAAMPPAVGLACFARTPITITARLIECECDADGGWLTPGWFSSGLGRGEMLVEPGMTRPPADAGNWFWLNLDPAGQHPDEPPLGEVVEVSGVFDHPDASGCTFTEMDGEPVPSHSCRLAFAVTRLVTVGQ